VTSRVRTRSAVMHAQSSLCFSLYPPPPAICGVSQCDGSRKHMAGDSAACYITHELFPHDPFFLPNSLKVEFYIFSQEVVVLAGL
jgi:hypothetical protein